MDANVVYFQLLKVALSTKTHIVRTTSDFFKKIFSVLSTVFKERVFKFQVNQASSFQVIALNSRASEKIDLYSSHTENKLQTLTFAAITLVTMLEFSLKCSPVNGQTSTGVTYKNNS